MARSARATSEEGTDSPIYIKGRIMEALTSDDRIAEHDIKVVVAENAIVAKGEVFTEEQKNAVDEVIKHIAPKHDFKNQVAVIGYKIFPQHRLAAML